MEEIDYTKINEMLSDINMNIEEIAKNIKQIKAYLKLD